MESSKQPEVAASPATPWPGNMWGNVHAMLRDARADRIAISIWMASCALTTLQARVWLSDLKHTQSVNRPAKTFLKRKDSSSLYPLKGSTDSVGGKLRTPNRGTSKALLDTLHQQSAACHSDVGSVPVQTPGAAGMAFRKSQLEILKVQREWFWTLWVPLAESNATFISPVVDSITSGLFLWHCHHKEPPPRQVLAIQRGTTYQGLPLISQRASAE